MIEAAPKPTFELLALIQRAQNQVIVTFWENFFNPTSPAPPTTTTPCPSGWADDISSFPSLVFKNAIYLLYQNLYTK